MKILFSAITEAPTRQKRLSMNDLIYRQDAIDAVFSLCEDCDSGYCGSCRVNYPGEKDVIKRRHKGY